MNNLDHMEIVNLLIQLGVMILAARLFGELARKLHQPMVVGEIIAGVILGPSIFGMLLPEWQELLFPAEGLNNIVLEGIISVSVVLLLFIAGMEVELDLVWQQGKKALYHQLVCAFYTFDHWLCSFILLPIYLQPGQHGRQIGFCIIYRNHPCHYRLAGNCTCADGSKHFQNQNGYGDHCLGNDH